MIDGFETIILIMLGAGCGAYIGGKIMYTVLSNSKS